MSIFGAVAASDIRDYGFPGTLIDDFLLPRPATDADWIVTNPPFRLGEQFISLAIERADVGVAMLVRTAFLESADRHAKLFGVRPPTDILQFVERVPMFKGRLDRHGSTATAYCWLVWRRSQRGYGLSPSSTLFHWLAPCRKRLERDKRLSEWSSRMNRIAILLRRVRAGGFLRALTTSGADGSPVPAWVKAECCGPQDVHHLRAGQVHIEADGYHIDGIKTVVPMGRAIPSPDNFLLGVLETRLVSRNPLFSVSLRLSTGLDHARNLPSSSRSRHPRDDRRHRAAIRLRRVANRDRAAAGLLAIDRRARSGEARNSAFQQINRTAAREDDGMTDYVLWRRGLRGPEICVLRGSSALNEYDRRKQLSGPTKIAPEHEGEPLSVLARLYPPPAPPSDGPAPPDAPAPAPKSPPTGPAAPAARAAVHEAA